MKLVGKNAMRGWLQQAGYILLGVNGMNRGVLIINYADVLDVRVIQVLLNFICHCRIIYCVFLLQISSVALCSVLVWLWGNPLSILGLLMRSRMLNAK